MKYINHKLIGLAVAAALFTSCVDEYECNLQVERWQAASIWLLSMC